MNPTTSTRCIDAENPWLGLESYNEAARDFFHGRDEEIAELQRRVKSHLLTVLFGQSGLGKTSLLQAGLFPKLRREAFFPVYLRLDFSAGAPAPEAQVRTQVAGAIAEAQLDATHPLDEVESLWEWLHRRDAELCDLRGRDVTPVLVFDQFEEIFTHGMARDRAVIDRFVAGLGDLVENRLPAEVEELLERDPTQAARFDFRRSDYRVLLSLREDFLPHLEELRTALPSLLQNRMRLTRLNGRQALDAVLQPGGALVTPEVATEIVRFVGGTSAGALDHLEVEPPLLSLVCHELNEQRRAAGEAQITARLLAGSRDAILRGFYEGCVAEQPAEVRVFVEDELVTDSGFRENIAVERARRMLAQRGAPAAALDELVQSRLLRVEDRLGVARVELAHDILTGVVSASRATRRVREEKEALERRQLEIDAQRRLAEEQAAEARRKIRTLRTRSVIYAVLAAAAVVAAIVALVELRAATEAQKRAEDAKRTAEESKAKAEEARIRAEVAQAATEEERKRSYLAQAEQSFDSWSAGRIGRAREMLGDEGGNDPKKASTGGAKVEDLRHWEWYFVKGLCDLCDVGNVVIRDGGKTFNSAALSPTDGDLIATGGEDGAVKLWNAQTGAAIRTCDYVRSYNAFSFTWKRANPSNEMEIVSVPANEAARLAAGDCIVAMSKPDGAMLETAKLEDNAVYDLLRGPAGASERFEVRRKGAASTETIELPREPITDHIGHTDRVRALAFSPDGATMVSGGDDNRLLYWDPKTGNGNGGFVAPKSVNHLAYSPDGKYLAFSMQDDPGVYLQKSGETRFARYRADDKDETVVGAFAFSPDGRRIAAVKENGAVAIWDLGEDRVAAQFSLADVGKDKCTAIAFSPSPGASQIAVLVGGYVKLFDPAEPGDSRKPRPLSSDQLSALSFAYSADGHYIATTGEAGPVSLWDVDTGKLVRPLNGHTAPAAMVAFSPNDERLISTGYDSTLRVWNLKQSTPGKYRAYHVGNSDHIGLAVSPDGCLLAAADPFANPPVIKLLDASNGKVMASFPGMTWRLNFSPDGKLLAAPEPGGKINVIDIQSRKTVRVLDKQTKEIRCVTFSPDGRWLASGGVDSQAYLWDLATGEGRELAGHTDTVRGIAFAPDSRTVVTATAEENGVRFFDVATATLRSRASGRVYGYSLRFSPDGGLLLTGALDGRVIVRDGHTGEPIGELNGHSATVVDIAFSPDGQRCVTVSLDRTERLWDVASRRELFLLQDDRSCFSAAFSPDGTRLFVDSGSYLQFWDAALLTMTPPHPNPGYYLARGAYEADLKQWQEAIAAYDQAFAARPPTATNLVARGNAWAELSEWKKALEDFDGAIQQTPDDTKLLYLRGLVARHLGRADEYRAMAKDMLDRARNSQDSDENNRAAWAWSLVAPGDHNSDAMVKDAVQRSTEAVRLAPEDYAAASTLGTVLLRDGNYLGAIGVIKGAMKLRPSKERDENALGGSPFDWVALAIANARLNQIDEARRYLEATRARMRRVNTDPLFDDTSWTWSWDSRYELEILRAEAESLVEPKR